MAHYVFNVSDGDREQTMARLAAKAWEVRRDERHHDALGPGDVALIYLAADALFIGRVVIASRVHDWTVSEAAVRPGSSRVLLSDVETWEPAVSMDDVVQEIDPTGTNPLVQANAHTGFPTSVVAITADECDATLAVRGEAPTR
jgi:hypothetical protein